MITIPTLLINDTRLISSTVPEVASAPFNPGSTYGLGATASVAGTLGIIKEYQSLQPGNIGHTPTTSPTWWKWIGDTYQVYSAGSTYELGERVIDPVAHLVYQSYLDGNMGHPLTDTTKWQEIGATNRYAMFDMYSSSATVAPGSITVVLAPGRRINALSLVGMVANEVAASATSGGSGVYTMTANLNTRAVFGAWDYCFKPFTTKPSILRLDIPPYTDIVITITITATDGNASVKWCAIGMSEYIGDIQYNPSPGSNNYSTVDRNFDGSISKMLPRPRVPTSTQKVAVDKSRVDAVNNIIMSLDAQPAIWAGLEDDNDGYFSLLLFVGFYTAFVWDLDAPQSAQYNLTLEHV